MSKRGREEETEATPLSPVENRPAKKRTSGANGGTSTDNVQDADGFAVPAPRIPWGRRTAAAATLPEWTAGGLETDPERAAAPDSDPAPAPVGQPEQVPFSPPSAQPQRPRSARTSDISLHPSQPATPKEFVKVKSEPTPAQDASQLAVIPATPVPSQPVASVAVKRVVLNPANPFVPAPPPVVVTHTPFRYTPLRNFLQHPPSKFISYDPRDNNANQEAAGPSGRSRTPRRQADPFPILVGRIATHHASVLTLTDIKPSTEYEANGNVRIVEKTVAVRLLAGLCPVSCWEFGPEGMKGRTVYIAAWNWVPARTASATQAADTPAPSSTAGPVGPAIFQGGYVEALVSLKPIPPDHFLDTLNRYDFLSAEFDPFADSGPDEVELSDTVSAKLELTVREMLDGPTQMALTQAATQSVKLDFLVATQTLLGPQPTERIAAHGRLTAKSAVFWIGSGVRKARKEGKKAAEHPYFFCRLAFGRDRATEFAANLVVQSPEPLALHMALELGKWYVFDGLKRMKVSGGRALVWNGGSIDEVAPPVVEDRSLSQVSQAASSMKQGRASQALGQAVSQRPAGSQVCAKRVLAFVGFLIFFEGRRRSLATSNHGTTRGSTPHYLLWHRHSPTAPSTFCARRQCTSFPRSPRPCLGCCARFRTDRLRRRMRRRPRGQNSSGHRARCLCLFWIQDLGLSPGADSVARSKSRRL